MGENREEVNYFRKNLNAMQENLKELKNFLEDDEQTDTAELQLGIEVIDGKKVLYVQKEEAFFQLDSMYDSARLLSVWKEGIDALYNTKYIIFGIGNGMFARTLLENTQREVQIFIYEPSEAMFRAICREFDLSDLLSTGRVHIKLKQMEQGEDTFYTFLSDSFDFADIAGVRASRYLNYDKIFPEEYQYYQATYESVMESITANRVVMERFGMNFYQNALSNYPYMAQSKGLPSLWTYVRDDIPAVIIASGPSLSRNIEELKKAKGKAFLIAADSAVSALLKHDIVPDLFVCVDANKNPGHFVDDRVKDIPLVCSIHTCQAALAGRRAVCFFTNDMNPHLQQFMDEAGLPFPIVSSGGSVANDAMSIGELIGLKTFILVGQDLAYTENKTHAEGTLRAAWDIDISETSCYVEGADGEPILSSTEFKLYRDWFEREIALKEDITVINATEGGAMIHGALTSTLKDAVETYCIKEVDILSLINQASDFFRNDQRKLFYGHMEHIQKELEKVLLEIQKGIRNYSKMLAMVYENNYVNKQFVHLFEKTKRTSDKLEKTPVMYYPECIMQTTVGEFLKDVYEIEKDEKRELTIALSKGRDYFHALQESIKTLLIELPDKYSAAHKLITEMEGLRKPVFRDEALLEAWDMIVWLANPDTEIQGYYVMLELLEGLEKEKDQEEFPLLLRLLQDMGVSMKTDMIVFTLLAESFLYEMTKEGQYLDAIHQYTAANSDLYVRQRYYIWWYLEERAPGVYSALYDGLLEEYRQEFRDFSDLGDCQDMDNEAYIIAVLPQTSLYEIMQSELLEECVELSKQGERVLLVFSKEKYAGSGILPFCHGFMTGEDFIIKDEEFLYQGRSFPYMQAADYMPNASDYTSLFGGLSGKRIKKVLSPEGSVLADLLRIYHNAPDRGGII